MVHPGLQEGIISIGTSVEIPTSVIIILENAFWDCTGINSITVNRNCKFEGDLGRELTINYY